ncbi:MAG: hypothetical protein ACI4E1_04485 [Lachnospira sp.]
MYYFNVNEESRTGGSRKNWDAIESVLRKKMYNNHKGSSSP